MREENLSKSAGRPGSQPARVVVARVLNGVLWLVSCGMAGTGLLLAFRMPPGSRGGHGITAAGMSRHEWGDIHTWLSYAFLVLVAAHLILHWRWFWQVAARKRGWPLVAGFGTGLALLLVLALWPVERPPETRGKRADGGGEVERRKAGGERQKRQRGGGGGED